MDGDPSQLQHSMNLVKSMQELSLQEIDDWREVEEQYGSRFNLSGHKIKHKNSLQKLFSIEESIPEENIARTPDSLNFKAQRIDLSNTRLADFPPDLIVTPHIYTLDLASNFLTRLDTWTAQATLKNCGSSLVRLSLARNYIVTMPAALFSLCTRLEHLDLSANLLRDITPVARITSLRVLDLTHNPFLFVDRSLASLSKLESLAYDWPKLLDGPPPTIAKFFQKLVLRDRYLIKDYLLDFGATKQQPNDLPTMRALVYDEDVCRLALALAASKTSKTQQPDLPAKDTDREHLRVDGGLPVEKSTADLLDNAVNRDRAKALFVLLCFLPEKSSRVH